MVTIRSILTSVKKAPSGRTGPVLGSGKGAILPSIPGEKKGLEAGNTGETGGYGAFSAYFPVAPDSGRSILLEQPRGRRGLRRVAVMDLVDPALTTGPAERGIRGPRR